MFIWRPRCYSLSLFYIVTTVYDAKYTDGLVEVEIKSQLVTSVHPCSMYKVFCKTVIQSTFSFPCFAESIL